MKYRKSSHAVYDCRYHLVWITKYRREVLDKKMQLRLKTILEWICKNMYISVIKIWMELDHVHMYISIPINQPIPYIVQKLKWRTSIVIQKEFKSYLKEYYWKPHLWATWYFICSVWEINDEIIKKYIEEQWREDVEGVEIDL